MGILAAIYTYIFQQTDTIGINGTTTDIFKLSSFVAMRSL